LDQKPDAPELPTLRTAIEAVPVTGFSANFSPMLRIIPLPLEKEIEVRGLSDSACSLPTFSQAGFRATTTSFPQAAA